MDVAYVREPTGEKDHISGELTVRDANGRTVRFFESRVHRICRCGRACIHLPSPVHTDNPWPWRLRCDPDPMSGP